MMTTPEPQEPPDDEDTEGRQLPDTDVTTDPGSVEPPD
jgi:hypothetical protein